jgi:type I restriction enzyme S subunit
MSETFRLGDHCSKIGSGATPRGGKDTYSHDGPFTLIRSQNIYNDRFVHDGLAFISNEQAAQLNNVEVKEGDVLLNITGDSVARACQVVKDVLPARVNQHVAIIRPIPESIDARFLRYFLVAPDMQAHMLGLAAAGATRNALTKGMIENFRIPKISIKEQRNIASILGVLDDKIYLNRQTNETLEAVARLIFKDWFVDFGPTRAKIEGNEPYLAPEIWEIFPDRLDDAGMPEGWSNDYISDFCNVKSGKRPPTKLSLPDSDNEVPVYGGNGVSWYTNSSLFEPPFIITGRVGTLGTVFRVYEKVWVSDNALCCFPLKREYLEYLFFVISGLDFSSLNSGSTQPLLTQTALSKQAAINAGNGIISAFSEIIKLLFLRVEKNCSENQSLTQTRDLLLPKLISGEIRVANADFTDLTED